MPRNKCVTRDTDASAPPPRGRARARTGAPKPAGAPLPEWPRTGDLVQCMWTEDNIIEGIVIDARDRGWNPPMITIITGDGEKFMWSSPNVRILSRRRRPAGKKKKCRARKKK